jgi:hypothetical protein
MAEIRKGDKSMTQEPPDEDAVVRWFREQTQHQEPASAPQSFDDWLRQLLVELAFQQADFVGAFLGSNTAISSTQTRIKKRISQLSSLPSPTNADREELASLISLLAESEVHRFRIGDTGTGRAVRKGRLKGAKTSNRLVGVFYFVLYAHAFVWDQARQIKAAFLWKQIPEEKDFLPIQIKKEDLARFPVNWNSF